MSYIELQIIVGEPSKMYARCTMKVSKNCAANTFGPHGTLVNSGRLCDAKPCLSYLPTPPLGQDMTQGQFFLSGV